MKKSIVDVINVLILIGMYVLILSTSIFYSSIPGLQIQISYVTGQYRICVYEDRFKITFSPIAPDFVFLALKVRVIPQCIASFHHSQGTLTLSSNHRHTPDTSPVPIPQVIARNRRWYGFLPTPIIARNWRWYGFLPTPIIARNRRWYGLLPTPIIA